MTQHNYTRGPYRRKTRAERFWPKVQKTDGCWLWTGRVNDDGYGCFGAGGTDAGWVRAHRVSWELNVGPIPEGMQVLHRCDNPACVNPDHLFLGTLKDNSRDMIGKGRGRSQFLPGHNLTGRWANLYDACVVCGTTDRRHICHGLCSRCYERQRQR